MKELKYIIEDKTIAELLGKQNFNNKESAVLELVKNAYDANAKSVYLIFDDNSLTIKDDGCGMTESDIIESWMHVGKSYKNYEIEDVKNGKRVLAGAKGIGRFALAKLGQNIEMYTCKDNTCIKWETDWDKSFLTQSNYIDSNGTEIIIYNLREIWDDIAIEGLCDFLSKTYNDDKMKIYVKHAGLEFEIKKYFNKIIPGKNCLSKIDIKFNGEKIGISVHSDEFLDIAQDRLNIYNKENKEIVPLNIFSFNNEIDAFQEIRTDARADKSLKNLKDTNLQTLIKELGAFSAELYFVMAGKIPSDDMETFLYKTSDLEEKLDSGVVLYRNAFSISSFEGEKDWLDLNKRVRKSPAAASHETGAWRVRDSQLGGKVVIDKKENAKIIELSNRQGVEENIYYKLFKQIICIGLKEFERYRQKIIRAIYKEKRIEKKEISIVPKFLKKPEDALYYSIEDLKKLAKEIQDLNKETKELNKSRDEVELKYKYDVRILNSLSTVGLKASSIAHEMQNDKGNLSKNVDLITRKLQQLNMWEELSSERNTRYSDNNVPKMLEDIKRVNQKILSFMKTMLTQIEKKQFNLRNLHVKQSLEQIKTEWEKDYSWVNINIECQCIDFYLADDLLKTIFDNLILNSVQQNENSDNLIIDIKIVKFEDKLVISYKDNGVGLIEKYRKEPRRILEVHESSRKNGHGLGMWIVNNSIKMSNGTIMDINGSNGFSFEFTLGDVKKKDGEV